MILAREEIASLIPHAGAMCLLDRVLAWDSVRIRCESMRHRAEDNPLRENGRLGALCAIEFASQAMAVHGRLARLVGTRPRAGYLASLRAVACRCAWLDGFEGALRIEAERLAGDEDQVLYAFSVGCGDQVLVAGRAAVLLQAAEA